MGEGADALRQAKGPLPGGLNVRLPAGGGIEHGSGRRDAHQIAAAGLMEGVRRQGVGQPEVFPADLQGSLVQPQPRRVLPGAVSHAEEALGFVEGEPVPDPALEMLRHFGGVGGIGPDGLPVLPAAPDLQRLGEVPVVQRHPGFNARLQKRVHQRVIVREARRVPIRVPVGGDPGPGGGEAVSPQPHLLYQVHVLPPAMITVRRRVAVVPVPDLARSVGKDVPDALPPSVLPDAARDLVRRGGRAPEKVF